MKRCCVSTCATTCQQKHPPNFKHICYIKINSEPSVSVTCVCECTRAPHYIIDTKSLISQSWSNWEMREYFSSKEKKWKKQNKTKRKTRWVKREKGIHAIQGQPEIQLLSTITQKVTRFLNPSVQQTCMWPWICWKKKVKYRERSWWGRETGRCVFLLRKHI